VVLRELAERLADAPWAPAAVLARLAAAPLDIARPLLARSPALDADALARPIAEGGAERLVLIARRGTLPAAAADALLDRAEPDSLAALAANAAIPLSSAQIERLAGLAERMPAVRAPLSRRPELTAEIAGHMLPWAGDGCRRTLAARFGLRAVAAPAEDAAAQTRYVRKLEQAGRLTPGYALRVLREGKLALFEQALAALGGLSPAEVRAALDAETADPLGRACALAGLDLAVRPVIAAHVRALNGGRPGRPSAEVA
jgi:uncharacterized protein (DUF2336 family)